MYSANCISRKPLLKGAMVKHFINFHESCLGNDCENDQYMSISFILLTGKARERKGHCQSTCQKHTAEPSSNSPNIL